MLENKKQEQIAGIISDFCDGTIAEADIDIIAMRIYENVFKDTKWQKLKEWLEEQQNNFKLISKTLGKTDYVLLSNCIKSVLSEMAKLEGEDE